MCMAATKGGTAFYNLVDLTDKYRGYQIITTIITMVLSHISIFAVVGVIVVLTSTMYAVPL